MTQDPLPPARLGLFAELRRRNVIRMAGLYLVGAWLLVQIAETLLPIFHTPDWVLQALVLLLALGLIPALVFAWVFELTPQGLKRESEVERSRSIVDHTARKLDIAVIMMLALVGGMLLWNRTNAPTDAGSAVLDAAADGAVTAAPAEGHGSTPLPAVDEDKSIAVLAFADLSPGKDQEYFADGIAEEILNALARLPGLRVAGRTSAFHFKGRNENLREIGSALDVAHILEGSVRKQGERVRITAQLIRSADGFHLWSETYDGDLSDVFALQERIARAITGELKLVLGGAQGGQLVNTGTHDADAYALYLRASDVFHRRFGPRYPDAIGDLEQAIAIDPGFARAHARLAALYVVAGNNARSTEARQMRTAVERHARQAIALDPGLAEPHAALGALRQGERRFTDAREALEHALRLEPNDVTALLWQGVILVSTGYREAGYAAFDRALAIDPLLPNALNWRARGYEDAGDLDTAERLLDRAETTGFALGGISRSRLLQARGERDAAVEQLAIGFDFFARDFPPGTARIFARALFGDAQAKAEALAAIDAHLATSPEVVNVLAPYTLIRIGEVERGLALAARGPTSNDALLFGDLLHSEQSAVFRTPGFAAFIEASGLGALWNAVGAPDQCRAVGDGRWECR